MCPGRESRKVISELSAGNDREFSRRLPPTAMWLARASLLVGVIFILLSLPMSADYNYWSNTPYPTYWGIFVTTIFLVIVYPTIPLVLWFYTGLITCVINALRRGGPKASLLVPVLSLPLCASWLLYLGAVRDWGSSFRPLYGCAVFAAGCTLMFFSTVPGFYYWFRRKGWVKGLSRRQALIIGWILWVLALFLPGYPYLGFSHPMLEYLANTPRLDFQNLMHILAWPRVLLSLWYYLALLAAFIWTFLPKFAGNPRIKQALRLISLGLLQAVFVSTWMIIHPPRGIAYYGPIAFAVGSMLICIGIWIIPPRRVKEVDQANYVKPNIAGGAALIIGWILWFQAMYLTGYPHLGFSHPMLADLAITLRLDFQNLMHILAWPRVLLSLWYYLALLAAFIWTFFPKFAGNPRIKQALRLISLGLLQAVFVSAWMIIHPPREIAYYYGPFALSVGSTLICIGVWLIPPRRRKPAGGEIGMPSTTSGANPDSGTEGTCS